MRNVTKPISTTTHSYGPYGSPVTSASFGSSNPSGPSGTSSTSGLSGLSGLSDSSGPSGLIHPSLSAVHNNSIVQPLQQCWLTFQARPSQRVLIRFDHFRLRSSPPECKREFVDLFADLSDNENDLFTSALSGRYCGNDLPRVRVSLHRRLVISVHSEHRLFPLQPLFAGTYQFISAAQFEFGRKSNHDQCVFEIAPEDGSEGHIRSPTYPGVYPQPINCTYVFRAHRTQRIRIEFIDFDLFAGGTHCAYDFVRLYDGEHLGSPVIGTWCGQKRSFALYSTENALRLHFQALHRNERSQNRGFLLSYEFSERFVNLGFVEKSGAQHVRGTECDVNILSRGDDSGELFSPNYPFPYQPGILCNYLLLGQHDQRNLQKVRIFFDKFDVPSTDSECSESYVRLFNSDVNAVEADLMFCGTDIPPSTLYSEGSAFKIQFASGLHMPQGQGFRVRFSFEPDFRIPGTPFPPACSFSYESESGIKSGTLNSPRYPAAYPVDLQCEYRLQPLPNEHIQIRFSAFKLYQSESLPYGYGRHNCESDWLEMYTFASPSTTTEISPEINDLIYMPSSNVSMVSNRKGNFLGRWCGHSTPGPLLVAPPLQHLLFVFRSDTSGVGSGFKLSYEFLRYRFVTQCPFTKSSKSSLHGIITSPDYPKSYVANDTWCQTHIRVRPGYRVLLHFVQFSIEGDMKQRGCPSAVVRVWPKHNQNAIELCGDPLPITHRNVLSDQDSLKLEFLATGQSVGAKGFKAQWTEVRINSDSNNNSEDLCPGAFQCKVNRFCIHKSLVCNGHHNCGHGDLSDEQKC